MLSTCLYKYGCIYSNAVAIVTAAVTQCPFSILNGTACAMTTSRFRRLLREPSSILSFWGAVTLWVLKTTIDRWNFAETLQHLPRLLDREFAWIIFFPDPHTSVMLVQSHFCNWPTTFREKNRLSVSLHLSKHRCLHAAWSCLVRMRGVGSTIFSRGATWLRWFPWLLHVLSRLLRARVPVWKLYFIDACSRLRACGVPVARHARFAVVAI